MCGIQFRVPQEMKNNTRHGYNEFDFEKLEYDNISKSFQTDMPQYIVYVQEPEIQRESDDKWRASKKAATQIGIPIVIIDREKFAQREWEKVEELQNIFLGKVENKNNVPETKLLEQIILKFENNATSVIGSSALSSKYFTFEQRNTMVKNIVTKIKNFEKEDFQKYQELFNKFRDIVKEEEDKTVSNTGYKVAESRYGEEFLEAIKQKCKQIEIESKKRVLKEKYQEIGIESTDLQVAKKILENDVNKNKETNIRE